MSYSIFYQQFQNMSDIKHHRHNKPCLVPNLNLTNNLTKHQLNFCSVSSKLKELTNRPSGYSFS